MRYIVRITKPDQAPFHIPFQAEDDEEAVEFLKRWYPDSKYEVLSVEDTSLKKIDTRVKLLQHLLQIRIDGCKIEIERATADKNWASISYLHGALRGLEIVNELLAKLK